jgi:hypothetical protein
MDIPLSFPPRTGGTVPWTSHCPFSLGQEEGHCYVLEGTSHWALHCISPFLVDCGHPNGTRYIEGKLGHPSLVAGV